MAIADLCSLAELRTYINPNRTDPGAGNDDAHGALAITAASDAIRKATARPLELQTAALDRYYTAQRPFGSNLINLAYWYPWPAVYPSLFGAVVPAPMLFVDDFVLTGQTIGSITVTDTISLVTYTPTQTWPFNATVLDHPFTALVFAAGTFLPLGVGQLKVNAKWGVVSLSTTVKQAALLQASRYLKRRDFPFGMAGLDPDVDLMLQSYRRWWAAA